jgi:hypothetical protein
MQGVGDTLRCKFVNRPQARRFERLQCSLDHPAVAPTLQERSKGRRHVLCVNLICVFLKMSYLYVHTTGVGGRHHMIKLGHTRLNQDAQLACASSPHYLLVDINV